MGYCHVKNTELNRRYMWSVQKVSLILNFRGLRIFDFRFFCGVVLVIIFFTYEGKFGNFKRSVNF